MIVCGRAQEILGNGMGDGFDVQITDPPYSEWVHRKATSQSKGRGTRHRDLGFDCLDADLRAYIMMCAATVKRWSCIYADVEGSHLFRDLATPPDKRLKNVAQYIRTVSIERDIPEPAEYVETLDWDRWSMPQLTGDRPPQAHEHLLLFAGTDRRKAWNGPGNLTGLHHKALRGEHKHKCEKPLDQILDLVFWFSDPGEAVLDLCAGYGTVELACYILGRECLSIEAIQSNVDQAEARLADWISGDRWERDAERYERWIETTLSRYTELQGKTRKLYKHEEHEVRYIERWIQCQK